MKNRLLRYEVTLLRRSFADAFGSTGDRVLLAVVIAILLLSAPQWLAAPGLPLWLMPATASVLALGWQRMVRAGLLWLAEESLLAVEALETGTRGRYLTAAHALLLIPLLGMTAAMAESGQVAAALGLAALGYLAVWRRPLCVCRAARGSNVASASASPPAGRWGGVPAFERYCRARPSAASGPRRGRSPYAEPYLC